MVYTSSIVTMYTKQFLALSSRKSFWNIFFGSKCCWYGSALYVRGKRKKDDSSVVEPYLDFANRFKDMEELTNNVKLRNLRLNPQTLKKAWDMRNELLKTLSEKEASWNELANRLWYLSSSSSADTIRAEIEFIQLETKTNRDKLKAIRKKLTKFDAVFIAHLLTLPNQLHPDTPASEIQVIHEHKAKPEIEQRESHVEIGERLNLLEISHLSPNYTYLKGNAALLELEVFNNIRRHLRNAGFMQFSNSDFVRSVIVEGSGIPHTSQWLSFLVENTNKDIPVNDDDRLHLVGSSSETAFNAFLTKQNITSSLPLKVFNVGRQYTPAFLMPELRKLSYGLFLSTQRPTIEAFVATSNDFQKMMNEYNTLLSIVIDVYKELDYHFKIIKVPASDLFPSKSFEAQIQMFSCFTQEYVAVGNISIYDDYISKRLMMCYEVDSQQPHEFLKIIAATVLRVPEVLACILEDPEARISLTDKLTCH